MATPKYIPMTEDMLKEAYAKHRKPKTKIKKITDNIFIVETKRRKK